TGTPPTPFDVARVRIEPRSLPPLPIPTPDVRGEAGGVETAAASSDKSRAATRQTEKASAPAQTVTAGRGTTNAKDTQARSVKDATTGARASVQLTSRASAPVRGEAVYAPGTTRLLLDARAPVLFDSDDEEQHPVRFNEKPYRGRLEVFANTR